VIREAAARDPASLPLLSFVLDELYRRDIQGDGSVLTFRTLEGAIARLADRLVDGLGPDLAGAVPALLLALVEIDEIKGTTTSRTLRIAAIAPPLQRELADRLVAERLAVVDETGAGVTLRLTHEALIAHWPRLATLIEEHRAFLVVRRRLQSEAANWETHGRDPDLLLPPGRRLAEADEVLEHRRKDLGHDIISFTEASIEAERQRIAMAQHAKEVSLQRELKRSRRIALIVFGLCFSPSLAALSPGSQGGLQLKH